MFFAVVQCPIKYRWSYYRSSCIYKRFTVQLMIFQLFYLLYNNIQPQIMMIVSNLIRVYNGCTRHSYSYICTCKVELKCHVLVISKASWS